MRRRKDALVYERLLKYPNELSYTLLWGEYNSYYKHIKG